METASTEPIMIFYIAYAFVALATAIAVFDDISFNCRNELIASAIASAIAGAAWPLLFTVKIISKILK